MTVEELKEKLADFPDNMEVYFEVRDDMFSPVEHAEETGCVDSDGKERDVLVLAVHNFTEERSVE